jgi:restriction system protein
MARKNSDTALGALALIIGAPILLADWIHRSLGIPQPVIYIALLIVAGTCIWKYVADKHRKFRAIQIANIDSMSGVEFEHYLQRLLTAQGYNVRVTQAVGDLGVDLVAARGTERIAIQAKRYKSKISRRAISDAVAGMQHYRCNRAMVITNSRFTPGAIMLARSTNCLLIDRDTLAHWIAQLEAAQPHNT